MYKLLHVPDTIKTENTQTNNKQQTTHTHTHTHTHKHTHKHKHKHMMNKIKTADKASISSTDIKSTEIGLKETESNRVSIAEDDE